MGVLAGAARELEVNALALFSTPKEGHRQDIPPWLEIKMLSV